MLKNHYINGVSSHTVIKRLLTTTMFSSNTYYSEQFEVESIGATITSALESCVQIYSCLVFKHIYSAMIGLHTLSKQIGIMVKDKSDSPMMELVDDRLLRFLNKNWVYEGKEYTLLDYSGGNSYTLDFGVEVYFVDINYLNPDPVRIRFEGQYHSRESNPQLFEKVEFLVQSTKYKMNNEMDTFKWTTHYLLSSRRMRLIWLLRLYTPINIGGLGMMPLIQSALSGHSDSKSKNVLYLMKLNSHYNDSNRTIIDWIYSNYYSESSENNVESLVSNLFPLYRTMKTYKDIIKDSIIKYLQGNKGDYNNKDIKLYMEYYKDRSIVHSDIVTLMKKKFFYRIARKYVDVSHINMIETFIQKLEHSQTILSYINHEWEMRNLIRDIFTASTSSYDQLFYRKIIKGQHIGENPELNLMRIKKRNYPDVVFEDILEPTYDSMLIEQYPSDYVTVHYGATTTIRNGLEVYTQAAQSGKVRPKYQMKYEMDFHFKTPAEYRVFEAVRYTKWAISASEQYGEIIKDGEDHNLISLCDYIIHYYCKLKYEQIAKFVMTPSGGELFHRTDNQGFKSSSNVRIYPNESGSIYVAVNPSFIAWTKGNDSNINQDYFRNRLITIALLRKHYGSNYSDFGYSVRENYENSSCDVRISVTYSRKRWVAKSHKPMLPIVGLDDRMTESFELVSDFLSKGVDITQVDFSLARLLDKLPGMSKLEKSLFTFKRNLEKYMNQTYSPDLRTIPSDIWIGLTDLVDPQLFSEKYGEALSLTKLKSIMDEYFNKESEKIYAYRGSHQQVVRTWLTARYKMQMDKLEMIGSNIKLLDSMCKQNIMFRNVLKLLIIHDYLTYSVEQDLDGNLIIKVNKAATFHSFKRALTLIRSNVALRISRNRSFCNFVRVYNDKLIDANIIPAIDELISDSMKWRFKASKLDMEAMTDIPRVMLTLNRNIKPIEFPSDCIKFNPSELRYTYQLNGALKWYENVVKNHCSLKAYDSKTGSQSYHCQYSFFKTLLRENLIGNRTKILDACSGRGDGHLALMELKMNHLSVSRGDEYDLFNCANQIHYDPAINIYNSNTLVKYLIYDHYHLDITFIKSKDANIWDTVCWLLSNNKTVSLRMNWITDTPSNAHLSILRGHDTRLVLGQNNRDTYYQVYLYIGNQDDLFSHGESEVRGVSSCRLYELFVNRSLSHKKYSVFDVDEAVDVHTEISFICSQEMLEHKMNELIDHGGVTASINEFTGIIQSLSYFIENVEYLSTYEDASGKSLNELTFEESDFGEVILKGKTIKRAAKPDEWKKMAYTIKELYSNNLIQKEQKFPLIMIRMRELMGLITAEVYQVPENFDAIQYMINVLLCSRFNQPSSYLQLAYSVMRRHFGRGHTGEKKMALNTFQFRCIANNISKFKCPPYNWGEDLKIYRGVMIREEFESVEEDQISKPEFFMNEEMLKGMMSMFSIDASVNTAGARAGSINLDYDLYSDQTSGNLMTAMGAMLNVEHDPELTLEQMIQIDLADAEYEYGNDGDFDINDYI